MERAAGASIAFRALQGAEGDQLADRGRQPPGQRGQPEENKAADEQPPAAEEVGEAAPEHQQPAEGQDVGARHPRQVAGRGVQAPSDGRQRDVDDGRVKYDDEIGDGQQAQRPPPAGIRDS
jgi:hypothetical protein